jgi:hypothetical protein
MKFIYWYIVVTPINEISNLRIHVSVATAFWIDTYAWKVTVLIAYCKHMQLCKFWGFHGGDISSPGLLGCDTV